MTSNPPAEVLTDEEMMRWLATSLADDPTDRPYDLAERLPEQPAQNYSLARHLVRNLWPAIQRVADKVAAQRARDAEQQAKAEAYAKSEAGRRAAAEHAAEVAARDSEPQVTLRASDYYLCDWSSRCAPLADVKRVGRSTQGEVALTHAEVADLLDDARHYADPDSGLDSQREVAAARKLVARVERVTGQSIADPTTAAAFIATLPQASVTD